jgi:predicted molibdopterin-dependent oxidoreductase YjgC
MERIALRIHQDLNLNTSSLIEPGEMTLLLPAQTRYEQKGGGTSTSTERRIRFSPEIPGHPQVGESKPEWEIPGLIAVAGRSHLKDAFAYQDSADIRAEMGATMPVYAGIENLQKEGDWIQWGGPLLCVDGDFAKMPGGKAAFSALEPPDRRVPEGMLLLTTRRGKQFNSMVFAAPDTLQGGAAREDLFLSVQDAETHGLVEGSPVTLSNELGSFDGVIRIADIAPGCVQGYWPELNVLIPRCWDPLSLEPDYNATVAIRGR